MLLKQNRGRDGDTRYREVQNMHRSVANMSVFKGDVERRPSASGSVW